MSVEMKAGMWESRGAGVQEVVPIPGATTEWRWESRIRPGRRWRDDGTFSCMHKDHDLDLIRYLGPIELSPTPACADQAGTPVVSPVSTETAGEQLQRMRQQYNSMDREASIYSGLLAALDQAKSDLGEHIWAMEKEHDL